MARASMELKRDLASAVPLPSKARLTIPSRAIATFKAMEDKLDGLFERASEAEEELGPFFEETSKDKDDLQEDAMAQLSFQDEYFRCLNHIPWLVMCIALFKVWAVPFMTVIFPILAWALPYILLRYFWSFNINANQYFEMLQHMWAGNLSAPPLGFTEEGRPALPSLWTSKSIAQFAIFGFSFAQSMIQPIQNAMHLYRTDQTFLSVSRNLVVLRDIARELRDLSERHTLGLSIADTLEEIDPTDLRRGFFLVKDQPEKLRMVLRDLARVEILWRLAKLVRRGDLAPVEWTTDRLRLEDAVDLSLISPVPSTFEVRLGAGAGAEAKSHAVITGPNGGGKSSFLRAVLQSVLLGHAYGVAPARRAAIPRLGWIASGLQLRDTPGVLSMFETEVKFGADILARRARLPGLVLFDELFHSTNPPDGARTAQHFLAQLWARRDVFSVVSTHVFPLIESAPKGVQPLCCQAKDLGEGRVEYSYRVESGICRVSSVRSVWDRFGLRALSAAAGPDAKSPSRGER